MSKHTKGPWEAADRGDYSDLDGSSRVILGDDRRIAIVQHKGDEEDEANARLIAAAPDMLEALEEIRRMWGLIWMPGRAREAIAKARGER